MLGKNPSHSVHSPLILATMLRQERLREVSFTFSWAQRDCLLPPFLHSNHSQQRDD